MIKTLKKIGIIFSIVAVIGGTLTFVMTWNNLGFGDGFLRAWLSSLRFASFVLPPLAVSLPC